MALRQFWLGSLGPFLYDDSEDVPGGSAKQSPVIAAAFANKIAIFDAQGRLVGGAGDEGSFLPASLFDAKGDLLVGQADDTPGVLSVGTTGQVLLADPTQPQGLRWGSAPALTRHQTYLGSDVSMATLGTFYAGPSLLLAEGTYLIICEMTAGKEGTGITGYTGRIFDVTGSTAYNEGSVSHPSQNPHSVSITLADIITLETNSIVRGEMAATSNNCILYAAAPFSSSGNQASSIVALKLD